MSLQSDLSEGLRPAVCFSQDQYITGREDSTREHRYHCWEDHLALPLTFLIGPSEILQRKSKLILLSERSICPVLTSCTKVSLYTSEQNVAFFCICTLSYKLFAINFVAFCDKCCNLLPSLAFLSLCLSAL